MQHSSATLAAPQVLQQTSAAEQTTAAQRRQQAHLSTPPSHEPPRRERALDFLANAIYPTLRLALIDLNALRPSDPVGWLADYFESAGHPDFEGDLASAQPRPDDMQDTMLQYCQANVRAALLKALIVVNAERPADPLHHLSRQLRERVVP